VSPDYDTTISARSARDMVWIMARTPRIPGAEFDALAERVGRLGYDVNELRRVPQQPLDRREDG